MQYKCGDAIISLDMIEQRAGRCRWQYSIVVDRDSIFSGDQYDTPAFWKDELVASELAGWAYNDLGDSCYEYLEFNEEMNGIVELLKEEV